MFDFPVIITRENVIRRDSGGKEKSDRVRKVRTNKKFLITQQQTRRESMKKILGLRTQKPGGHTRKGNLFFDKKLAASRGTHRTAVADHKGVSSGKRHHRIERKRGTSWGVNEVERIKGGEKTRTDVIQRSSNMLLKSCGGLRDPLRGRNIWRKRAWERQLTGA